MKISLLLFVFLISLSASAQFDRGNNSHRIPLPESATSSTPETKPFEIPPSIKDPIEKPRESLVKKNNFSMMPKDDFKNPGDIYEEKFNKRGEGNQYTALRKNQSLGDFKTNSPYIMVQYRDYGQIDGDQIQLINNGQILLLADVLTGDFKKFRIDLAMGFNKIDILALNNGAIFPNTAAYEIFDADGKLITANSWQIFANFKASLIIVRE